MIKYKVVDNKRKRYQNYNNKYVHRIVFGESCEKLIIGDVLNIGCNKRRRRDIHAVKRGKNNVVD